VRLAAEASLARTLHAAAAERLLTSSHDLSDGGLAQALAEAALLNGVGVDVTLADDPFVQLFSESTARVIVACRDASVDRILEIAAEHDVPVARLGRTGGTTVQVNGLFDIAVDELRTAHETTLPQLFG
jgi:phosphoribosylformylglycinamidine synthase subunit PurL